VSDELKLLVEWSNPWEEFRTAIGPALGRSPAPLAGEAPTGLWPYRGMATAWGCEALLLIFAVALPAKIASMRPYQPSPPPKYDVLYFTGDELPRTEDFGGAEAGRSGRAGGKEAFHRSQTIHVARGSKAVDRVVDAPNVKLPVTMDPVANLLAVNRLPGPAPAEGLRPSHTPPTFSKDAIVAPPPEVIEKLTRTTPSLASSVIAPPPNASDQRMIAGMTTTVIAPPPPDVSANRRVPMTGLAATIIAPAPDVAHEQNHALVAMNTPVVAPPPRDPQRELPPLTGPATQSRIVVPPPVSAPERVTTENPKLTLPAPGVIAPPPSQVVRDQRTLAGAALGDPNKVVPPPVQPRDQAVQRNVQGLLGSAQVVPPPPNLGSGSSLSGAGGGVPDQHGVPGGTLGARAVIPPPPSVGGAGSLSGPGRGQGTSPTGSLTGSVIPPPPNTATGGLSGGSGNGQRGGLGGTLSAANVVPPPPNVGTGGGLSGRGTGNKGNGFGGPMDPGSGLAPPGGGGNGKGSGVVVSGEPGSAVGKPGSGGPGSIALSPAGGKEPGLGGGGGGEGIGHGNGPGSGLSGEGPGGGHTGSGKGADPSAKGGISQYPGPGGAGSGASGQPAMPGVSVQGGSTTVNLPSFGGGNGNEPNPPGRSGIANNGHDFDVTVVGTSRSGGAFNNYHLQKGAKTYTRWFETPAGTVSMEYWDTAPPPGTYGEELEAPQPMRVDLPKGLGSSRLVIFCILDRSGILKDLRISEAGAPEMAAKILAALPSWKFRPAFRGNEPVDVTAILGFNIDTSR
jgi:hypothetical protein